VKHARADYMSIQDPTGRIPEDEPVFLLRGKDVLAPKTVEAWADLAEQMGASSHIVATARQQAKDMRKYQKENHTLVQVPDMNIDDVNVVFDKDNAELIRSIHLQCRQCLNKTPVSELTTDCCPNCGERLGWNAGVVFVYEKDVDPKDETPHPIP
jgi:hypothetical protein